MIRVTRALWLDLPDMPSILQDAAMSEAGEVNEVRYHLTQTGASAHTEYLENDNSGAINVRLQG